MADLNDFFKLIQTAPKEVLPIPEPLVEEASVESPIEEYSLNDFFHYVAENKEPEQKIDVDTTLLNDFFEFSRKSKPISYKKKREEVPLPKLDFSKLAGFLKVVSESKPVHEEPPPVVETIIEEESPIQEAVHVEEEIKAPVVFEEPLKEFQINNPAEPILVKEVKPKEKAYITDVGIEQGRLLFVYSDGKKVRLAIPQNFSGTQPVYVGGGGGGDESAYSDASKYGYVGTEEEFFTALAEMTNKYQEIVDIDNPAVYYKGRSLEGSLTASPVWRIIRYEFVGVDVITTYADGDQLYDNVWEDRLTLSYS